MKNAIIALFILLPVAVFLWLSQQPVPTPDRREVAAIATTQNIPVEEAREHVRIIEKLDRGETLTDQEWAMGRRQIQRSELVRKNFGLSLVAAQKGTRFQKEAVALAIVATKDTDPYFACRALLFLSRVGEKNAIEEQARGRRPVVAEYAKNLLNGTEK